MLGRLLSFCYS